MVSGVLGTAQIGEAWLGEFLDDAAPPLPKSFSLGAQLGTSFAGHMRAPDALTLGVGLHTGPSDKFPTSLTLGASLGTSFAGALRAPDALTLGLGLVTRAEHPVDVTLTPGSGGISLTGGSPTVVGPPATLILERGGVIKLAGGSPTLAGGITSLQCFIGNVNRSDFLAPDGISNESAGGGGGGSTSGGAGGGPLTISYSTIGRSTATFDLFCDDGSFVPQVSQTVAFSEFGRKLFMGCLTAVTADRLISTSRDVIFHCAASDKSSILDHRLVNKVYPVGTDVQTMILDIVKNSLQGEGITTTGVAVTDTLDAPMTFSATSVSAAFDQITSLTGAQWWVDMDGDLHFTVIASAPAAPFGLTETSDDWRNLAVTTTLSGYANRFTAVSNTTVLPGDGTGTGSGAAARSETYTLGTDGQDAAFAAGLPFGYILTDLPIQTVVGVTVNGVAQNVFGVLSHAYDTAGWYFFDGVDTSQVVFPFTTPSIGNVIVVSYIPLFNNSSVQSGDPISGTCGSGIFEGVIQAPNVTTQDALDAIAAAYVARNGQIPIIAAFEVDRPGLEVGQALSVNIPNVGLSTTTLYITQVTANWGKWDDVEGESSFYWAIEATNQQSLGNWLTWYERLLKRTDFPLPVLHYESASFSTGAGEPVTAGALGLKQTTLNSGPLTSADAIVTTAPVNQDLYIQITLNGGNLFLPGQLLKIPAGSTAQAVTSNFYNPGIATYTGDVVEVTLSYNVLGTNPVAAVGLTINLNHSY